VLAHREELLTQARDKLQRALGGAAGTPVVAIERGALRAPPDARVLVCSIRAGRERSELNQRIEPEAKTNWPPPLN